MHFRCNIFTIVAYAGLRVNTVSLHCKYTKRYFKCIVCVCVCVCLSVCLSVCPKAYNDLWCDMNLIRLNKFYCFYMATVVGIISGHGLTTDAHHRNQLNMSKIALYKLLPHVNSRLKQLLRSDKMEYFDIRPQSR